MTCKSQKCMSRNMKTIIWWQIVLLTGVFFIDSWFLLALRSTYSVGEMTLYRPTYTCKIIISFFVFLYFLCHFREIKEKFVYTFNTWTFRVFCEQLWFKKSSVKNDFSLLLNHTCDVNKNSEFHFHVRRLLPIGRSGDWACHIHIIQVYTEFIKIPRFCN